MIGRLKGYRVSVVMPENVSAERSQLLYAYGADILFSDGEKGSNGAIEVAQEFGGKAPPRLPDDVSVRQSRQSGRPL